MKRRTTVLLLAGFLIPALLAGTWAVLVLGGVIEGLRREEVQAAEAALEEARAHVEAELASSSAGVLILLNENGVPAGPFLPPPKEPGPEPIAALPLAVRSGLDYESQGRPERAIPFLRQAEPTAPGILALARCLAATGAEAEARALLAEAREPPGSDYPLPFALLARLLDLRIAAGTGDPMAAEALRAELLRFELRIPAEAAAPVLDLLRESSPEASDADAYLAAARVQSDLESAALAVPERTGRGPGGCLLVPNARGLRVIPGNRVPGLLASSVRPIGDLVLSTDPTGAVREAKLWGQPLYARFASEPASARLQDLSRVSLVLAALAFVACNLLVLRVLRRELHLSRMKSEFIDLVSHELRTPMTALTLKAEMLASGDVPPEKLASYHRGLHAEAKRLAAQIHKILDFAHLEKGTIQPARTEARSLLAMGVRQGRQALSLAKQQLRIDAPRDLPLLEVDPELLARALRNLLENAAKFSPEGSTVTLSARASGDRLEISIADEGPGVAEEETVRIFRPFQRGRRAGDSPGSGLGLALVHESLRAHRGSVSCENGKHGGAVFTLRLPVARQAGA